MKIVPFLCLLLTATAAATAQPAAPAPEKELLVVDFFNRIREIPASYTETLRGHVLEAFAVRGRHRLLDAGSSRILAASAPGTGLTDPATAEADMAALLAFRAPQAADLGARFLVSGTLTAYKFEHVDLPPAAAGKPPRPGFRATFRVVLSALDLKLGERLPDEAFDLMATAPAATDADLAALARIRGSLEYYIDRNFRFETQILELCPPDRKGRLRELYIHCGTEMGVRQGDLFLVYEEVPVGGVMTRRKIGKLRVNDAQNTEAARCKVTKGDAEIARAYAAGLPLICVSDGKAFGF